MTIHSAAVLDAAPVSAPTSLAAVMPAQPATFYPAGTEIYAQGERSDSLYQVEFGAVRVYRLLADGRRQIAAFHLAGEVFGFEAHGVHHFFAEAIAATGVRAFRLCATADFSRHLLPLALQGLVRAQEHLLVLGRQSASERLAAFLIDMAERQGGLEEFDLPMSRADIADYLGLTIETVSRTFTSLRKRGLIALDDTTHVRVLDRAALEDMAAGLG